MVTSATVSDALASLVHIKSKEVGWVPLLRFVALVFAGLPKYPCFLVLRRGTTGFYSGSPLRSPASTWTESGLRYEIRPIRFCLNWFGAARN